MISTGEQLWFKLSKDGKKVKIWTDKWSDGGKFWLEGDLACIQYEKLGGPKNYLRIYHNPEGTSEEKNEYLNLSYFGIFPWSLVD